MPGDTGDSLFPPARQNSGHGRRAFRATRDVSDATAHGPHTLTTTNLFTCQRASRRRIPHRRATHHKRKPRPVNPKYRNDPSSRIIEFLVTEINSDHKRAHFRVARPACLQHGGTPQCLTAPCRDGCLLGDVDRDGDLDLYDFRGMQNSYSGAAGAPGFVESPEEHLLMFDIDEDEDIDLTDYRSFGFFMSGP